MDNLSMRIDMTAPLICAQMVTQNITDRKDGKEAFDDFLKTVIRGIQYQVPRLIFRSHFCGKPTSKTAAINDHVMFMVLLCKIVVDKLHVIKHLLFTSLASALSKTPVV